MQNWFSPERHWWRLLRIFFAFFLLGATVRWWAEPLLAFVSDNTDLIQGLTDAIPLLCWAGAALYFFFTIVLPAPKTAEMPANGPIIVTDNLAILECVLNRPRLPAALDEAAQPRHWPTGFPKRPFENCCLVE